ncbi:MAG: DUF4468 domain-containing protein [Chitinophagaceae bacterium]
MKTLFFFLLSVPFFAFSQKFQLNDAGQIEFTEVVKVDSADGATLYKRAKQFFATNFKNAKDVTQVDDPSTKKLVVKKLLPVTMTGEKGDKSPFGVLLITTTIECRDGRYKYSVKDLYHEYYRDGTNLSGGKLENESPVALLSKDAFKKVKLSAEEQVMKYIWTLKINMKTNAAKPVQKDW